MTARRPTTQGALNFGASSPSEDTIRRAIDRAFHEIGWQERLSNSYRAEAEELEAKAEAAPNYDDADAFEEASGRKDSAAQFHGAQAARLREAKLQLEHDLLGGPHPHRALELLMKAGAA